MVENAHINETQLSDLQLNHVPVFFFSYVNKA